jgi:hypothetical protein
MCGAGLILGSRQIRSVAPFKILQRDDIYILLKIGFYLLERVHVSKVFQKIGIYMASRIRLHARLATVYQFHLESA